MKPWWLLEALQSMLRKFLFSASVRQRISSDILPLQATKIHSPGFPFAGRKLRATEHISSLSASASDTSQS